MCFIVNLPARARKEQVSGNHASRQSKQLMSVREKKGEKKSSPKLISLEKQLGSIFGKQGGGRGAAPAERGQDCRPAI